MNRTLSLTTAGAALVLFATSLMAPMQASAADRQISVNPNLKKLKTFTVDTRNQDKAIEVANTNPEAPKNVKPKAFRVQDEDEQVAEPKLTPKKAQPRFRVEEENEQVVSEPKLTPKKVKPKAFRVEEEESEQAVAEPKLKSKQKQPKVQEFRVDEDSGEVADTPIESDDEEVASSQEDRPVNTLNKKKLAPAIADDEQTAASDEETSEADKEEAIAADTPETEAPADDEEEAIAETEAEDDGEPTILRKMKPGKKYKNYVVNHNTYYKAHEGYGYQQQSYEGPACNNSYSY